jgi:KaiC/GvpD/RAD55 family RecA-like ATPase
MSNKDIALQYQKMGLSVIPLKSPSMVSPNLPLKQFIRQCKIPLISWKKYQTQRPTEQEVSDWFDRWPDANIGIVTGKVSGIVVFDLDSDHAVQYAEDEGGFPDTPKVKTGKGYHCYMKYPGFVVRNDVRKELDIDIRADGGYVVAPPSIHGSGNHYEWEDCSSIFDVEPAPCEPWQIDYLKDITKDSSKSVKEEPPIPSKGADTASKGKAKGDYADILNNGAAEGMRNHTAIKIIGHLIGKGNDEAVVWELVKQWNVGKNNPPLDETELRKCFESVLNLEAKSEKKSKEKKDIDVVEFLDTEEIVTAEYDEHYVRVPFAAGNLLSIMESKMNGGLIGGRTYVLGGIPSSGKTVLTNNIADNICLNGHPVLFFSYDDGRAELRYRTYCRFSGFDIEEFNNHRISKSDLKTIYRNENITPISKSKYIVQQIVKVEDWPQLVDKIYARQQKSPVIMIDYLRKVKTESNRMDERLRVDEILSKLTEMAKTHNIPVLVISELARDSYKTGQRLSMASFKESGSIEYEASWLGILAAVEEDGFGYSLKNDWERIINQDGNIDLIVFKAKRGTGVTGRIALKLEKSHMTVRDRIEATKSDGVTPLRRASKFD